jgi:hypothetical protein
MNYRRFGLAVALVSIFAAMRPAVGDSESPTIAATGQEQLTQAQMREDLAYLRS